MQDKKALIELATAAVIVFAFGWAFGRRGSRGEERTSALKRLAG